MLCGSIKNGADCLRMRCTLVQRKKTFVVRCSCSSFMDVSALMLYTAVSRKIAQCNPVVAAGWVGPTN